MPCSQILSQISWPAKKLFKDAVSGTTTPPLHCSMPTAPPRLANSRTAYHHGPLALCLLLCV